MHPADRPAPPPPLPAPFRTTRSAPPAPGRGGTKPRPLRPPDLPHAAFRGPDRDEELLARLVELDGRDLVEVEAEEVRRAGRAVAVDRLHALGVGDRLDGAGELGVAGPLRRVVG